MVLMGLMHKCIIYDAMVISEIGWISDNINGSKSYNLSVRVEYSTLYSVK